MTLSKGRDGILFLVSVIAVILALGFSFSSADADDSNFNSFGDGEREGKSLFSNLGVPIQSDDCFASNENGTCVSAQACKSRGGKRLGSCAGGFGACCMLVANCTGGGACPIRFNGTRIVLKEKDHGNYQYVIQKPRGVNQVKLDFLETRFENPDVAGDCSMDRMSISGSMTANPLVVCGNMSNQHMYLDFGDSDRITLNLRKRRTEAQFNVDIKTTFIPNSNRKVPAHCLQYYTDSEEVIRSFGFPFQLNDQRYTICIESNSGSDRIDYTGCERDPSNSFVISGDPGLQAIPLLNRTCNKDWIQIFGENRLCGTSFPMKVQSSTRPFMVHVNFDDREFVEPALIPMTPGSLDTCTTFYCYLLIEGSRPPDCQYKPNPSDDCRPAVEANEGDIMNSGFCLKFNRT